MNHRLLTYAFAITAATSSFAQHTHVMDVNTKKAGATVQNTMYGLFFEDINYAADGGLYGELVKNRSFEFPQSFMGWQTFGNVELKADGPFGRGPHYVVLSDPQHVERRTGLVNEGYFGIGVEKGEEYRFTVWAKAPKGSGRITVQLINPATMGEHQDFASVRLDVKSAEWQKYEVRLKANQTNNKAQLRIFLDGRNTVCLEHVSLFPVTTSKANNRNRRQHTFTHRFFPDYYQSYGLGFFEYFQLSEDIGAEPLPVLNVGMSCQFQNRNNAKWHVPVNELKPYIDDCLDLIEFANGDTTTTWGRKRAEMGHPAPFNLKIIGVGNEQWDTLYFERLAPFVKAIKAKHPDIMIVGTSGPDSEGKMFEIGWKAMKELKADLVDEHFYRNEEWFLKSGLRYAN